MRIDVMEWRRPRMECQKSNVAVHLGNMAAVVILPSFPAVCVSWCVVADQESHTECVQ